MPIYFYWGEDEFTLQKAVTSLRDRILDPQWSSFNYSQLAPEQPNAVIEALDQVMTPPFGTGSRLIWLVNTTICQHCGEDVLTELKRTLPVVPDTSVLLLTCRSKPDGRLKSTQLLQNYASFEEFSLISPWDTKQLLQQVQKAAASVGVKLTQRSVELVVESVGNDTRQLYSEMEKLLLYARDNRQPLDVDVVAELVRGNNQNSLQLAAAIRSGDVSKALLLVAQLIDRNEPGLKIVATLIGQFRTWLWVKLMMNDGERSDRAIALAAEVSNPKRIYFLQQEVKQLSLGQLVSTLPLLLELEVSLKQGREQMSTLQTKVIELCQIFRSTSY
ncbi:MAG TPA: DNA polymerase III subunit delta [Leptolyngbyaceae cyanobacterium]